jgi:hypothetical protein
MGKGMGMGNWMGYRMGLRIARRHHPVPIPSLRASSKT